MGTKALREKLVEMGYQKTSKSALHITAAKRIRNVVLFEVRNPIVLNALINDKAHVEAALSAMYGIPMRVRFVKDMNGDEAFSPQMQELKRYFGGTLMWV